jgi:uncharacterized protein (DUF885 family)
MALSESLNAYVRDILRAQPVEATKLGVHEYDHTLGDVSADAFADLARRHRAFRDEMEAVEPANLTRAEQLDWRTAVIEARTAVARDEHDRIWERAPYWYCENLGSALSVLMTRESGPVEQRGEALRDRLRGVPEFVTDATNNLTVDTPLLWAQTGVEAAGGLERFLRESVRTFAQGLPPALADDISSVTESAGAAVRDFGGAVQGLMANARGSWAAGSDYFDFLLREYQLLDIDHDELFELGKESALVDRGRLEGFAQAIDRTRSWADQIARIKDDHPEPADFIATYEYELNRARRHTEEARLATLPDGEICTMAWVPDYMGASIPIAVMNTTPPFERGLASQWLITPSDPNAPEDRRVQQMRDNCKVFAESIAGHEIYPGHHLQKVHHKLATQDSMIRRYFSSPQFMEGWGLYVEDLFEETGFFNNSAVLLFKLRNAVWRSLRVIIDVGLHTKSMSFDEAVALLREGACLDTHMAEGEVRRYTRHDNPTYPSSYLLGCLAIHDLQEKWKAQRDTFTYLEFHDKLLSYGTLPLKLVADQMLTA